MSAASNRAPSTGRSLLFGALTVAALDALDAVVFFGLRGVAPIRIFQSIASGVLGRAAFSGGLPAAALGGLLHVFIASGIVTTYYLVSRRVAALRARWWIWGPLYGLVVYIIMNFVIVPLSLATRGPLTAPIVLNGLLIHALGVGLPSAWFSRSAVAAPGRVTGPSR